MNNDNNKKKIKIDPPFPPASISLLHFAEVKKGIERKKE